MWLILYPWIIIFCIHFHLYVTLKLLQEKRNIIDKGRLSDIALLYIEKLLKINFDQIISEFYAIATQMERRLQLT